MPKVAFNAIKCKKKMPRKMPKMPKNTKKMTKMPKMQEKICRECCMSRPSI
jgi:hypothetical protein